MILLLLAPQTLWATDLIQAVNRALENVSQKYQNEQKPTMRRNLAISQIACSSPALIAGGHHHTVREVVLDQANRSLIFQLVERDQLDKILAEQALQQTGITSDADQLVYGRLLNAHVMLTGSLIDLGENLSVNLRLIDIETGKVFSSAQEFSRETLLQETKNLSMAYLEKYAVGISISMFNATLGGSDPGMGENNTHIVRPVGLEIRYRFNRYLTAGFGGNLIYATLEKFDNYPYSTSFSSPSAVLGGGKMYLTTEGFGGFSFPLHLYTVYPISKSLNVYALFGIEPMLMPNTNAYMISPQGAIPAGNIVDMRYRSSEYRFKSEGVAFNFGAGVEKYIMPRLALSFRLYYSVAHIDVRSEPEGTALNLSGISFAPAVSLYF